MITQQSVSLFEEIPIDVLEVDREQIASALSYILKDLTLEQFVSLLTNKYKEVIEYVDLCEGESTCQKTSLLFNPHRLDTTTIGDKRPSIFKSLEDEKFCSGLARATLFKKGKVSELLYQVIQLGINGRIYVNEFPPHVSRNLCKQYGCTSKSKVLDPCAGWGGRMIGSSVVVNEYVGYEPSTRTFAGLMELNDFIRSFRSEFNATIECLPYEESSERLGYYDFALTSPPYFNTELYADEPTQSFNRWPTYEEWRRGFFIPLVDKTMRQIKPGAAFILNIGSRKYDLAPFLKSHFNDKYHIKSLGNLLSGSGGFGKEGTEGECFYEITGINA